MRMALAVAAAASVALSGCATVPEGVATKSGWVCNAQGIKAAEYGGGDVASIHLESQERAGVYSVRRINDTTARGMTQNGTSFECRRAPS